MRTPQHDAMYRRLARRRRTTDVHGLTYGVDEVMCSHLDRRRHREIALQTRFGMPLLPGRRAE